jgi:hypothetical protein
MGLLHLEVVRRIEPRDDRTQRLQQAARLFLGQLFGECAERLAARADLLVNQRGWTIEAYGDYLFRGMSGQLLE